MDHFKQIYSKEAEAYQKMIAAEDCEERLRSALESLVQEKANRILDLGTGTGRIPTILESERRKIIGLDFFFPMLQECQRVQRRLGSTWSLLQGDMRWLPFPEEHFDLVIAGWAIGHWCAWAGEAWRTEIGRMLAEMERVTRKSGTMLVLETMGTGQEHPAPPTPRLAQYYHWLEEIWQFQRLVVATDFQFASPAEAAENTEFFFGPELSRKIRQEGWSRIPEWTGIWQKIKA